MIYDGYNPSARRIGRYCGATLPDGGTVNTTHYVATLFFHADASVNRDGFGLRWRSVRPSKLPLWFLSDRTTGGAYATVLRPSVVVCL